MKPLQVFILGTVFIAVVQKLDLIDGWYAIVMAILLAMPVFSSK